MNSVDNLLQQLSPTVAETTTPTADDTLVATATADAWSSADPETDPSSSPLAELRAALLVATSTTPRLLAGEKHITDEEIEAERASAHRLILSLAGEVSGDDPEPPRRRRGAQPGNLNALRHGRRSSAVRRVREVMALLSDGVSVDRNFNVRPDSWLLPKVYGHALRWSAIDNAALHIAVLKKADVVRWRLAVVDALINHDPLPPPPSVLLTKREEGLYRIFLEQRRALAGTLAEAGAVQGPGRHGARLTHAAVTALAELEEWQEASAALPYGALEATGFDAPSARKRLRAVVNAAPPHTNQRTLEQTNIRTNESFESPDRQ